MIAFQVIIERLLLYSFIQIGFDEETVGSNKWKLIQDGAVALLLIFPFCI